MDEQPTIGHYRLVEKVGSGGMGIVYRAVDLRIGRSVAVKVMRPYPEERQDLLKRFIREARSAGILQHANIVVVHELDADRGVPYIVMEYLEGESLDKLIAREKRLSVKRASELTIQACRGLAFAHSRGVIHRDVKPANIFLTAEGTVKLLDFGIARLADSTLSKPGQALGTLPYMSPEHLKGGPVDARTDIFSAGVALYELLTGVLPFKGEDAESTIYKILNQNPLPLQLVLGSCPPGLQEVISRALAKKPEARFAGADEFADALLRQLNAADPLQSDKREPVQKPRRAVHKSKLMWIGGIASLLVLSALTLYPDAILQFPGRTFRLPAWYGSYSDWVREQKLRYRARNGDVGAQYDLASWLNSKAEEGTRWDLRYRPRSPEGYSWLQKAAEAGHAKAQYELGDIAEAEENYGEAAKWFRKAAAQGNPTAQWRLGSLYELGRGVERDESKAFQWYYQAAKQGEGLAAQSLAYMDDQRADYYSAYVWYRIAEGYGWCMGCGQHYKLSQSQIQKADAEAAEWLRNYPKAKP